MRYEIIGNFSAAAQNFLVTSDQSECVRGYRDEISCFLSAINRWAIIIKHARFNNPSFDPTRHKGEYHHSTHAFFSRVPD